MENIILIKSARFIETIKKKWGKKWFEVKNYITNILTKFMTIWKIHYLCNRSVICLGKREYYLF